MTLRRRRAVRAVSGELVRHVCLAALGLVILTTTATAQGGLSFIRDAEIEALLEDYSKPIFEAAGLGSDRVKVRVIRDDGFNAFVLDGRNVFMNTGTLAQAATPNEVIGVIAHETGHIAGGHLAGLRAKIKRDQTRLLLMQILGIGAMAAGAATGSSDATSVGSGVLQGSNTAIMRSILSYRRVQESAADQAAVRYLNATKQSSKGMLATFERFAQQELFSARHQDTYVRSHPMAQQRLSQLRDLANRSAYFEKRDPPRLQLRHDLMRAKLAGFLDGPQTVLNRYPQSDQSLPARYARSIAAFFSGGINSALPKIDALIRERPDYAYFWELKGELLVRSGRPGEAMTPLRKAHNLVDGRSALIRIRLAQALIGSKEQRYLDEAIKHLRNALVEENNPLAYRQLATAYWSKDRKGEAYLASAQAHFYQGRLGDAKRFAKRAQPTFPKGSAKWVQADDIIKFRPPGK